jgi:hypothetical protein
MKHIKILKLSAIAAVLSTGLLLTGYTIVNKNITLVVKGNETEISTLKSTASNLTTQMNNKVDTSTYDNKILEVENSIKDL